MTPDDADEERVAPSWGSNLINVTEGPAEDEDKDKSGLCPCSDDLDEFERMEQTLGIDVTQRPASMAPSVISGISGVSESAQQIIDRANKQFAELPGPGQPEIETLKKEPLKQGPKKVPSKKALEKKEVVKKVPSKKKIPETIPRKVPSKAKIPEPAKKVAKKVPSKKTFGKKAPPKKKVSKPKLKYGEESDWPGFDMPEEFGPPPSLAQAFMTSPETQYSGTVSSIDPSVGYDHPVRELDMSAEYARCTSYKPQFS